MSTRALGLIASVVVLASGCNDVRDTGAVQSRECTACHGDPGRSGDALLNAAPPRDLNGNTEPSAPGVGAHAVHLGPAGHLAVPCGTCHVVPTAVFSPGHVDGPQVHVVFGGLASLGGQQPKYDQSSGNCSNTYCHGPTAVRWTAPRDEASACGTCHGLPPALPHTQNKNCSLCHGEVIAPDRSWKRPELHVDGKVEVAFKGACNACHGQGDAGAPPPDLSGQSQPSAPGAGAHAVHLTGGATHGPVDCAECHVVPAAVDSPGHIDNDAGRAQVVFGTIAHTSGRAPAYAPGTQTCAGTYCHGPATPAWTNPPTSADACGTCHGLPPALPHTQDKNCSRCHGEVIAPDGSFVRPEMHVDGTLQVAFKGACNACHGQADAGAPPPDLAGQSSPSAPGAGSHAVHLTAGATHGPVDCAECHVVPAAVDSPGHIDNDAGRAEVVFGTIARTSASAPAYAPGTQTCAGTYCHGSATPAWTNPPSSQAACGTCHGLPPALPHAQDKNCSRCHDQVIAQDGTFLRPELHVDGTVQVASRGTCNACHGQGGAGAPPPDLSGQSSPSAPGAGSHAVHLTAGASHAAVSCAECHVVPAAVDSPGHIDNDGGRAEVVFGTLARSSASSPAYAPGTQTCSSTYCHGPATPAWTNPPPSAAACGTCHGLPPPPPHSPLTDCSRCHGQVIAKGGTFVRADLHVNGTVEFTVNCASCHGTAPSGGPPPDLAGSSDPTVRGVGAHALHLSAGPTHAAVPCAECHLIPSRYDSPGHRDTPPPAEVTFGSLAKAGGAKPTYDASTLTCSGTYCHAAATPTWTAPKPACGTCHGLAPPPPHPPVTDCSRCHGMVIDGSRSFVRPDKHIDGQIDVAMTCSSCHGSGANGAPPPDLGGGSDVSRRGVGAHQAHLTGGASGRPVACAECHVVPSTIGSHGLGGTWGPASVKFSGTAVANGFAPAWDPASGTCTGTYCHGPDDLANRSPVWTAPSTGLGCTSCHGMPPPDPHASDSACGLCHTNVDASNRIINRTLHVNGVNDL
jgi:predicted CxxxxCH...CXXCH cytochrome family protein